MNSNLLKEAIADAKAVRATALANARASLEEAFNQRFSAVFADKLREDSATEAPGSIDQPVAETVEPKDATPAKNDGTKGWSSKNTDSAGKPTAKSITPNTVPAAKDGGDATKGWSKDNKGNAFDGTPAGVKENTTESAVEEDAVEETVTNEDLDEIIRELEAEAGGSPMDDPSAGGSPMDAAGDDSAADLPMDDPSAAGAPEPIMSGDTITITKTPAVEPDVEAGMDSESPAPDMGDTAPPDNAAPAMEEEVDLNELIASLNEESTEKEEDDEKEECDETATLEEKDDANEVLTTKLNEAISERDEAYKTVSYLRTQINEVNLLNAKLLYTNKLFKEFGMDRNQKTQVVEAFDLTKNVREVKMTYANWCSSLNFGGKAQKRVASAPSAAVRTITEGMASKPVASTKPKSIITEGVNDMALRFQKLAGIPMKK